MTNWPSPNPQPISSACRSDPARAMSSHKRRDGDDHQRPPADRLKGEGRRSAGGERDEKAANRFITSGLVRCRRGFGRMEADAQDLPRIGIRPLRAASPIDAARTCPAGVSGRRAGRPGRQACRLHRLRRPVASTVLGELLELDPRVGFPQAVVEHLQHSARLLVMLILDLADDFLDHVLDRYQAFGSAELVDDDGQVDAFGAHPREKVEHSHRFGTNRGARSSASIERGRERVDQRLEHVLDVDHADHFIEVFAGNRQAAVLSFGESGDQILETDRRWNRDDVAACDCNFADRTVAEVEQVAEHLSLDRD